MSNGTNKEGTEAMQTQTTNDRLHQTYADTVILYKGARHIDNGDGRTACGFPTDERSLHQRATGALVRISCRYCARGETYPA